MSTTHPIPVTNEPRDLSIRDAWQRYLNHRQTDSTQASLTNYHYRLKLFVEWTEHQDVESVSELDGWILDSYENHRQGIVAPVTLYGEMKDLRNFIRYLARIEAVPSDLPGKVHIPRVEDHEKTSEKHLDPEAALRLRAYYRDTPAVYGSRLHAFFEIAWHTGARLGGIRGLDVRDFNSGDAYLEFHHRPDTGTPLKNKRDGERVVGLPPEAAAAIQAYVGGERYEKHDEHGRQPLLTSSRGRPGDTTVRNYSYMTTWPCRYRECPHGKDPESCEFKSYHGAHGCPSSRAPHHIRKGSITWQRDLGFPPSVVAERVNAAIATIEQYYDKASPLERLERRRREYVDRMEDHEE